MAMLLTRYILDTSAFLTTTCYCSWVLYKEIQHFYVDLFYKTGTVKKQKL